MRSRNIKPSFFKNEELSECSMAARLLFAGLWCLADRSGRLEDRPKRIKAEIFPYDPLNIEKELSDLAAKGFIVRYSVDSSNYIQITNFQKHQYPHIKEPESTIPAPCENHASPSESLIPHTESPIPDPDIPAVAGEKVDVGEFEEIWAVYPKKVGKEKARAAFRRTVRNDVDVGRIREALRRYAESRRVKDGFIQDGSRWFANWQDWENYEEAGNGKYPRSDGAHSDIAKPGKYSGVG